MRRSSQGRRWACDQPTATATAVADPGGQAEFSFATGPGVFKFFFGDTGVDQGITAFEYTGGNTPNFSRDFVFTISGLAGHTVDNQSPFLETVASSGGMLTISFSDVLLGSESSNPGVITLDLSGSIGGPPPTTTPEPSTLLLGCLDWVSRAANRARASHSTCDCDIY